MRAGGPRAAISCPSATRELFDTRSNPIETHARSNSFPKQFRILRTKDYRRVYDRGSRVPGACFLAFCLAREANDGPRVGLTVPKTVGNAVVRNRIKRRMREAVRTRLGSLAPRWDIVFNPRKSALDTPMPDLEREVEKVFRRCNAS